MSDIRLKRAYESPSPDDGKRVLVERLWPRGVTKQKAELDLWIKEIAPSTELRKWFDHDPKKWEAFSEKYRAELDNNPESVGVLREKISRGPVTLVYAARDQKRNSAVVLKGYLEDEAP